MYLTVNICNLGFIYYLFIFIMRIICSRKYIQRYIYNDDIQNLQSKMNM